MDPASHRVSVSRSAVLEDGLGKRYEAVGPAGELLEMLVLHNELTTIAPFESTLHESARRFAAFQHPSFARVHGVHRLAQASALCVVSERVPGTRLSEILAALAQHQVTIEAGAALGLVQQIVRAVAALHAEMPGVCHGAIAPERIVITPGARVAILDHIFATALEELHFSHEVYWKDLCIPLPKSGGLPHFDQRADVLQVGAVALAILHGRPLDGTEYPDRFPALAEDAWRFVADSLVEAQPGAVRTWLMHALQLDARQAFASAVEASAALELAIDTTDHARAFSAFMAEYARLRGGAESGRKAASLSLVPPASPVSSPVAAPTLSGLSPTRLYAQGPRPASSSVLDVPAAPAPVSTTPSTLEGPGPSLLRLPDRAEQEPVALPPDPTPEPSIVEEEPAEMMTRMPSPRRRWIAAVVLLVAFTGGGALVADRWSRTPDAEVVPMGTLVVNTNPPGAAVVLDGERRGAAPLTLDVTAGKHVLEVLGEGEPRRIPLTITAGATMSQHIDLPVARARAGQLQVQTEPSGARVTIDGVSAGVAPLTVEDLAPGMHTVVLADETGSVTHNVLIEAGATASLVVPMGAPQGVPVSGWIAVSAPVEVQVYENERLLGSSRSDRIMVSVGRHELDIVADALGYRARQIVNVSPGRVSPIKLEWPTGSISVNAQPWADVWIDGERVGETPIGNVALPIGPHTITFRHPELGEHVAQATVTLSAPTLVSVDLRRR